MKRRGFNGSLSTEAQWECKHKSYSCSVAALNGIIYCMLLPFESFYREQTIHCSQHMISAPTGSSRTTERSVEPMRRGRRGGLRMPLLWAIYSDTGHANIRLTAKRRSGELTQRHTNRHTHADVRYVQLRTKRILTETTLERAT